MLTNEPYCKVLPKYSYKKNSYKSQIKAQILANYTEVNQMTKTEQEGHVFVH